MSKLSGKEVAEYIKARQAKQVASISSSKNRQPKLSIVFTSDDPVISKYMGLKQRYGVDIGVEVEQKLCTTDNIIEEVKTLNKDNSVDGIIIQLPLADESNIEQVLNSIDASKDVDGLAQDSEFDSATPNAIRWLLAAYNVELKGKKILVVGQGRLVGKPLAEQFIKSELDVETADINTNNLSELVRRSNIIITAVGVPGLIKNIDVQSNTVIVDAGTSSDKGKIVGDSEVSLQDREDIKITPVIGGVGPLTVAALFDNVIRAAS